MPRKKPQTSAIQQLAQNILTNLCNFLPHYVFWKDTQSVYLGCNENFAKLVGLNSPEEIIGLTDARLPWPVQQHQIAAFLEGDRQTMQGKPLINNEEEAVIDNGHSIIVLVNKRAIYDDQGQLIGVLGVATDITEQKTAEQELLTAKQAAEQAASANQRQADFIANISHDLRTPLNGVIGMAERLKRLNQNPEYNETIECIVHGGHTLLSLVEDILNVAKLEAGKLLLQHEPFDLKELIDGAIATLIFTAQQKNLQLKVNYQEHTPHKFVGDPSRIKRVIMNLVGNAIKFTDHGYILVTVQELNRNGEQVRLQITVKDTGIGVPESKLNKIFERFETIKTSYKTNKEGAGLGLTIVKEFIEGMGGHIRIESIEHVGTTFICELPLALQTAEHMSQLDQQLQISNTPQTDYKASLKALKAKILLVEDNYLNQKVVSILLEELGCQVTIVDKGKKALEAIAGQQFDLMLLDIGLPDIDGITVAILTRQHEAGKSHLPIVALTGHVLNKDRKVCLEAGMDWFLTKPISADTLEQCLARFLL